MTRKKFILSAFKKQISVWFHFFDNSVCLRESTSLRPEHKTPIEQRIKSAEIDLLSVV